MAVQLTNLSTYRQNLIKDAISSASTKAEAVAQATKMRWYDDIVSFLFPNSEKARSLDMKRQEIKSVVEASYDLKTEFLDVVEKLDPNLEPRKDNFKSKLEQVIFKHADKLPPALNGAEMSYGFNPTTNSVVLRLSDEGREAEINLFSLDENTFTNSATLPKVLENMPKYWFGTTPDAALKQHIAEVETKANGDYFENNYKSFLKDADRQEINGLDSLAIQQRVGVASNEMPAFVPQEKRAELGEVTDVNKYKKLNAYEQILNSVNPHFTNEQKDVFFRLFSQTASPCPNGIGINTEYFGAVSSGGIKAQVTSVNGGLEDMLLTIHVEYGLKDSQEGHHTPPCGKFTATSSFLIDRKGTVLEITAEISKPVINSEKVLSYRQRLTLRGFVENREKIKKVFVDHVLDGMVNPKLLRKGREERVNESYFRNRVAGGMVVDQQADVERSMALQMRASFFAQADLNYL